MALSFGFLWILFDSCVFHLFLWLWLCGFLDFLVYGFFVFIVFGFFAVFFLCVFIRFVYDLCTAQECQR